MTLKSARISLALPFLLGLLIQAALFFGLVALHELRWTAASSLLKMLVAAYSIPLAVIFTGVFASERGSRTRAPLATFWIAFVVSCLWNLLLVVPAILYFIASEADPEAIQGSLTNSESYNFLVAGALTYFFAAQNNAAARVGTDNQDRASNQPARKRSS